jgi:hypothetical protein
METITNSEELKSMIRVLEQRKSLQELALKQRTNAIVESVKPINILKRTFGRGLSVGPPIKSGGLLQVAVGIGAGILLRRIFRIPAPGKSRQFLSDLLQQGINYWLNRRAAKRQAG